MVDGTTGPIFYLGLLNNFSQNLLPTSIFHRWGDHEFTGHNSPLFAMPGEMDDEEHPGYGMNRTTLSTIGSTVGQGLSNCSWDWQHMEEDSSKA